MKNLLSLVLYGRIDEPADIGQTVLWLAFDLSDYMNGTRCSSMMECPPTQCSEAPDE